MKVIDIFGTLLGQHFKEIVLNYVHISNKTRSGTCDCTIWRIIISSSDLTGSIDGSVRMWEFGTQRVVSQQRSPGTPSITEIRFTPQGNKYGVADTSGKLHLWQGIHTSTKTPYKVKDREREGGGGVKSTCGHQR